jgi:glycosidase
MPYSNQTDKTLASIFERRESDWRCGSIVYQVLVDRFAPSTDLAAKQHLYPAPKKLMDWEQLPKMGRYLREQQLWSHEIEFWGGDLNSLQSKLDYIHELGVDVLYLNPIHYAYTNHKYDALDFHRVSPEFGERSDVMALANALHEKNMRLVLDGVFNHMGRNAEIFQQAYNDPNSSYRSWFEFDETYSAGYRCWQNAHNLPELVLENHSVRQHIYADENSVVLSYLNEGIDGWRLDVAHDIGFKYLQELTDKAHQAKPESLIVGEIWCYPQEWFPSVDGVMNFTMREIILHLCRQEIKPHVAMNMLQQLIVDADFDHLLMSWLVLDNHDTPRLQNLIEKTRFQRLAQIMQFTLPGAPNLYYGSELGLSGGDDPEMRAPMPWDKVADDNDTLNWHKRLINVRKHNRALSIGNIRFIHSDKLLAYERFTNRIKESVFVFTNPTTETITETLLLPNSKLMNAGSMINLFSETPFPTPLKASLLDITLEPGEFLLLKANTAKNNGYSNYKRVN